MYQNYLDIREEVAIPKIDLLEISAEDQICETFGIHPQLTTAHDLYNEKDLLFLSNTGVMTRPVDKSNYGALTRTQ